MSRWGLRLFSLWWVASVSIEQWLWEVEADQLWGTERL